VPWRRLLVAHRLAEEHVEEVEIRRLSLGCVAQVRVDAVGLAVETERAQQPPSTSAA
jgi:hypothetical protein